MTSTPVDPSDAVVLFADLPTGIIERAATNDLASLRRAVATLARLAQLFEDGPVLNAHGYDANHATSAATSET